MTTKNVTTDQKVDLVLEKLVTLDSKVDLLSKNQNDLIKTVGEIALLAGQTADKLDDLSQEFSGIQDEQERQGKKLDQITGSFSPNISGAFVA